MASFGSVQSEITKPALNQCREKAMAKLAQHQFYQSDKVKQFNRRLILYDTLNERDHQMRQKQARADQAKENNRRLMEQVKCREMQCMAQEKERATQREQQKKTVADFVKQQLQENELVKQQQKVYKGRDLKKRRQSEEQCEKEMELERRKDRERKSNVRRGYTEQILAKKATADKAAERNETEENRRRRIVTEKDNWSAMVRDVQAVKDDELQRRTDIVAQTLASRMREAERKEEQHAADVLAAAQTRESARWAQALREEDDKQKAMRDAIAAHREHAQKQRQRLVMEERQRALSAQQALRKEHDRCWENEELLAQKKRKELRVLNEERYRHVTVKRADEKRRRAEDLEFDAWNAQKMDEEDAQFRAYTASVLISATARMGPGRVVSPAAGGLRTDYLVPGATYTKIPDYTRSVTQDVPRHYSANEDLQSTKFRPGLRTDYLVPAATAYTKIPDYTRSVTQDVPRDYRANEDLQSTKFRLGLRTDYLVPGATACTKIPDYTRSVTQGVPRYYRANEDLQSTKFRLGFDEEASSGCRK